MVLIICFYCEINSTDSQNISCVNLNINDITDESNVQIRVKLIFVCVCVCVCVFDKITECNKYDTLIMTSGMVE